MSNNKAHGSAESVAPKKTLLKKAMAIIFLQFSSKCKLLGENLRIIMASQHQPTMDQRIESGHQIAERFWSHWRLRFKHVPFGVEAEFLQFPFQILN